MSIIKNVRHFGPHNSSEFVTMRKKPQYIITVIIIIEFYLKSAKFCAFYNCIHKQLSPKKMSGLSPKYGDYGCTEYAGQGSLTSTSTNNPRASVPSVENVQESNRRRRAQLVDSQFICDNFRTRNLLRNFGLAPSQHSHDTKLFTGSGQSSENGMESAPSRPKRCHTATGRS